MLAFLVCRARLSAACANFAAAGAAYQSLFRTSSYSADRGWAWRPRRQDGFSSARDADTADSRCSPLRPTATRRCTSNCPTWSAEACPSRITDSRTARTTNRNRDQQCDVSSPATGSNAIRSQSPKRPALFVRSVGLRRHFGYGGRQLIQATALARSPSGTDDCMLTLSSSGGFSLNGDRASTPTAAIFFQLERGLQRRRWRLQRVVTVGTSNDCGASQQTGLPSKRTHTKLLANNPLTAARR